MLTVDGGISFKFIEVFILCDCFQFKSLMLYNHTHFNFKIPCMLVPILADKATKKNSVW